MSAPSDFADQALAALAGHPCLVGPVDQHAAELRAHFTDAGLPWTSQALRDYRDGLAASAVLTGWTGPGTTTAPDPTTLRLLAATRLLADLG